MIAIFGIWIDRDSQKPLLQQLTTGIRQKVLTGELKGGDRLPPSRSLARDLGIARNTIVQAYEQLIAEGYLESRTGSGTYVTMLTEYRPAGCLSNDDSVEPKWQTRRSFGNTINFHAGNPDMNLFPVTQWAKLLKEACLDGPATLYEYSQPAGEWRLRSAIAEYSYRSKGIVCQAEQVYVTPGSARGMDLLVRLLAQGGHPVAVEDPSIDFIQHIVRMNGCPILPVPVDRHGLITVQLPRQSDVRLIYVVPSHQYPTGGVLPIGRRLQLLEYARETGAYIIEDDYDSEFRYQGEPIQPLRHLDPERVIYLGTFSKILSPALRIGYLIAPMRLQARLNEYMEVTNLRTPAIEQAALAAFIQGRHLDRHVYKMKRIYERKRSHIIHTMHSSFGGGVSIAGENAGMHVLAIFRQFEFQPEDFARFRENGVEVDWVEDYAIAKGFYRNQLVMGYGNLEMDQITEGIRRLKNTIDVLSADREINKHIRRL